MLVSRALDAGYWKMPDAAPEVPRFVRGRFSAFPFQRAPVNTRLSLRGSEEVRKKGIRLVSERLREH